MVTGVATENQIAVLVLHILHTHHGGVAEGGGVDHKSEAGVKGENLEGGFVFLHIGFPIRKHHAVGSTADMRPVCQLLVLGRLILTENIIVQAADLSGNVLVITSADILDGFAHQIADLEGHVLIGSVFNDFVADFRPYFLLTVKHGLISTIVPIEIVNVGAVLQMDEQSLLQNINDVPGIDFGNIGIDHTATKQRSRTHLQHLLSTLSLSVHSYTVLLVCACLCWFLSISIPLCPMVVNSQSLIIPLATSFANLSVGSLEDLHLAPGQHTDFVLQ